MEVKQVFSMNPGTGKASYASNSLLQRTVISVVKPVLEESILELLGTRIPDCLVIADLGCSTGPNTLLVASEIIDTIDAKCQKLEQPPPTTQFFLNDLPTNDFNTLFRSLPSFMKRLEEEKRSKFSPCFIAGIPGTFYGRLFPRNSLHFVHSSYALHWLSQAPKELECRTGEAQNKGNICAAKSSPPAVFKAYFQQFERDFTLFLKSRAEEMVSGGHMVLTTLGSIKSDDPLSILEPLGMILNDMVVEGLIEEEKLYSFNLPHYTPTAEEVKKLIEAEGSFTLNRLQVLNMDWDAHIKKTNGSLDKQARADVVAKEIRAIIELILVSQFGKQVVDDLFQRFKLVVLDYMAANKGQYINLVISLSKNSEEG